MLFALLMTACSGLFDGKSGDTAPFCDSTSLEDSGVQVGVIDPSCACHAPVVEIGTGSAAYVPVAEGADVQMVHGPQGGWHLLAAVQVVNTRNVIEMVARAYDVESGLPVTTELVYRVQLVAGEFCAGTFPNMFLYLDPSALAEGERDTAPELLACHEVRIELCVEDTGGRSICETKTVHVLPDPVDVEAGLAQSCG